MSNDRHHNMDIMSFANCAIQMSNELGIDIINLKLQKLLSEIQVFYKENSINIFRDKANICRHGMIYPRVYSYYKTYFNDNISFYDERYIDLLANEDLILVQDMIIEYKDYNPWDMVKDNLNKIKGGYFDILINE